MDECLFVGNIEFNDMINRTQKRFEPKPVEWDNVEFLGVKIVTKKENNKSWLEINHTEYIEKLQKIPVNANFERFRFVRASLSWLCLTRPDICCAVSRACPVLEEKFSKSEIRAINKLIRRLKKYKDIVLRYLKLDVNAIHNGVYSDASFASNDGGRLQHGEMILLCDEIHKCHVLAYCSKKSKRIVRSIVAEEVFAFSAAFDQAFFI